MNIFFLSLNPKEAAQYHNDKHVVKMNLETAQILSAVHHKYPSGGEGLTLYKPTHLNHPCTVWASHSRENFEWLLKLAYWLNEEYVYRFNPKMGHKSYLLISKHMNWYPAPKFPHLGWTEPAQAMPEEYRIPEDAVRAYRRYYKADKAHLASWTRRGEPKWWSSAYSAL